MKLIYARIRKRACQIASRYPLADFYKDFPQTNQLSREFFEINPVIAQLKDFAERHLEDDFGHGMVHAVKVTLDAGALIMIESEQAGYAQEFIERKLLLAQCAGLLHDIKRKEKEHAIEGSIYARKILKAYPLFSDEIEDICQAIRNHEAFKKLVEINTTEGLLVSNALYDADKFRWGPDNFTDTIWKIVSSSKTPLSDFIQFYPKGMEMVQKVKATFRSNTGKKYGPQFIDMGLAIGKELYDVIMTEFSHKL